MAELGSIPLKLRLRIEAAVGGSTVHDVGYADIDISLPVSITPTHGMNGAGAQVSIDTTALTTRLTDAVAAFETAVQS